MQKNKTFTYVKNGSSFDIKAASLYEIVLLIDQETAGIGIVEKPSGEIAAMEIQQYRGSQNLSHFLGKWSEAIQKATKKNLYFVSPEFTLVPEALNGNQAAAAIIHKLVPIAEGSQILSDYISDYQIRLYYPEFKELRNQINAETGPIPTAHHFSSMLIAYHTYYVTSDEPTAFVQLYDKWFTVALYKEKALQFFNAFAYTNEEDIIYYSYYSLQQFEFNPANTAIHIGGYLENVKDLTSLFQRYSKEVYRLDSRCCDTLKKGEKDVYLNLILSIQCGL